MVFARWRNCHQGVRLSARDTSDERPWLREVPLTSWAVGCGHDHKAKIGTECFQPLILIDVYLAWNPTRAIIQWYDLQFWTAKFRCRHQFRGSNDWTYHQQALATNTDWMIWMMSSVEIPKMVLKLYLHIMLGSKTIQMALVVYMNHINIYIYT